MDGYKLVVAVTEVVVVIVVVVVVVIIIIVIFKKSIDFKRLFTSHRLLVLTWRWAKNGC